MGLWGDSKWTEFYIYDAYVAPGLSGEAQSFYNRMMAAGHAQVMVRYFALLGQYFPAGGQDFARSMR